MNHRKMIMPAVLLAGLIGASSAMAADNSPVEQCAGPQPTSCVILNGGGSSAATPFMSEVPLQILDQSPHYPVHYVNGNGKRHVWTGTRSGVATILRYEATGSADGIQKLQVPTSNAGSNMTFVDHTSSTGCSAPSLKVSHLRSYFEYTGCSATTAQPMTMGMADVAGGSFHQSSPGPTGTITKTPISMTGLTSTQVAMVPWSFVVGPAVQKMVSGTPQNITGLSRTQIESIFSGATYDWTQLGLVTVNSDSSVNSTLGSAPITLCMRQAGSGSKAAFDETVMKDATEVNTGTVDLTLPDSGAWYFGASTQDVVDCIQGNPTATGGARPAHPDAIGYIDRDTAELYDGIGSGTIKLGTTPGYYFGKPGAYPIKLNGLAANDSSLSDPKINVKCGQYLYWAGERENVRSGTDPGIDGGATSGPQHSLATAFINASSSSSVIANLPAGAFWVAKADMYASKNLDAGPIVYADAENPCNTND